MAQGGGLAQGGWGSAGRLVQPNNITLWHVNQHQTPFQLSQKEANASLVDTDLCQFGACEDGSLVQLNLEGGWRGAPFSAQGAPVV